MMLEMYKAPLTASSLSAAALAEAPKAPSRCKICRNFMVSSAESSTRKIQICLSSEDAWIGNVVLCQVIDLPEEVRIVQQVGLLPTGLWGNFGLKV
jgi:hypothetical protein